VTDRLNVGMCNVHNKKAQLTLTNSRDAKAYKNCSNFWIRRVSFYSTKFHFPKFQIKITDA